MAALVPTQSKITGSSVTKTQAESTDTFRPGNHALLVLNGSGVSINVTVTVPGLTKYGQAQPDVVVAVAAGVETSIGPFPDDLADPTDGFVHVAYSATTTVSRRLVRL